MKLKGRRKVQPVQNGKQLYHIQAVSDYSDEPLDYFVWCDGLPTKDQVRKILLEDDTPEDWVEEILELYEVYSVYAEEV